MNTDSSTEELIYRDNPVDIADPPAPPVTKTSGLRLVVVGKSGTGKSTLCNQLAGRKGFFPVGHGLQTHTQQCHEEYVEGLTIVDTSDDMEEIVNTQKPYIYDVGGKVAMVLCIRWDARFAAGEYSIYKELKNLWGDDNDFCRRLVVAFTHGDAGDESGDSGQLLEERLNEAWPQLRAVVQDAGERYVVFRKLPKQTDGPAVKELLEKMEKMDLTHWSQSQKAMAGTPWTTLLCTLLQNNWKLVLLLVAVTGLTALIIYLLVNEL